MRVRGRLAGWRQAALRLEAVEAFRIASPGDSLVTEVTSALGTLPKFPRSLARETRFALAAAWQQSGVSKLEMANKMASGESARPSAAMEQQNEPFAGCTVTIHSLRARPDLNGNMGEVVAAPLESGRFPMRVGEENLALKKDNLRLPALPRVPQWEPPAEVVPPTTCEEHGEEDEDEADDDATEAAVLEAASRGAATSSLPLDFLPFASSAWRVAYHAADESSAAGAAAIDVSAEGGIPPPEAAPSANRFNPAVCGGRVASCDVSTPDGLEIARQAVAARRPVLLRGGARTLLGHVSEELSSTDGLSEHLSGRDVSVLYAPPNVARRFTYYFDDNRYEWNLMAPPPVNKVLSLPWDADLIAKLRGGSDESGAGGSDAPADAPADALADAPTDAPADAPDGVYYMQLSLATRTGGAVAALGAHGASPLPMHGAASEALVRDLQAAVRSEPMSLLASELGVWQSSMLYVGPAGTLAPCHWDHLDNVFTQAHSPSGSNSQLSTRPLVDPCVGVRYITGALVSRVPQLAGTKQVLLFAPDESGLRPFPRNHPFDSRAQVDLERPTECELHALRGRGALATLEAGDALYIPQQCAAQ